MILNNENFELLEFELSRFCCILLLILFLSHSCVFKSSH